MSTIFTKIIDGDIPGRFVWSDEHCVGFLSINPLGPGHTLVVPRAEIDQWVDAPPQLMEHLTRVAHAIGVAVREIWAPPRVGLMVAGFEVPHLHVHVFPAPDMSAFDFAGAAAEIDGPEQDGYAGALREALRGAGHGASVPDA